MAKLTEDQTDAGQGGPRGGAPGPRPGQFQSERRGATMSDVAKIAGVSAMTVSRALRDPKVVNEDTLKRIQAAIESVGFVPNRLAIMLSLQRSNVMGQIVPNLRDSLFVDTMQGVADTLGTNYHLLIADSGYSLEGEEAAIEAFLSQKVCGLLLHNTDHTPRARKLIKDAGVPCVETGNLTKKPIDMTVGFSNFEAAFSMTEYLIGKGYRRIGFISLPTKDNERAAKRREGYMHALEAHGRQVDPSIIMESLPGLKNGGHAFVRLMESTSGIDAVFLTGDVLAIGAMLEANRRGWRVPDDVAIAGSDDNEMQENFSPAITSIRFPRYEIGRHAARLLLDRIEKDSTATAIMDLGFKVIERQSA